MAWRSAVRSPCSVATNFAPRSSSESIAWICLSEMTNFSTIFVLSRATAADLLELGDARLQRLRIVRRLLLDDLGEPLAVLREVGLRAGA
jgi:hypothetical protein